MNILEKYKLIVDTFPDKVAVADKNHSYTFKELYNVAKRISYQIHKYAVNEPILVIANHESETILMMLGVLLSGNYYIPIDIEMPKEKINTIVKDSMAKVVIGNNYDESLFEGLHLLSMNDLEENSFEIDSINEDNRLYVVYTSGSTGKPKGVVKSFKAMRLFIDCYSKTFGLTNEEIIGNQSPFYFDASAKDIYLMLWTGATIQILGKELFVLPISLINYMNENKVNFISWVPSALSIVVQLNTFSEIKPKYLKNVFFVGEVMPVKHLNKWISALPNARYVNLYGQSEIAGICCYYEISNIFEKSSLPIGKPLQNCEIVLNEDEICIISDSLAEGYYNDQEKTNNAFKYEIINNKKCRVFHTGDLATYDEEGNLVFIGRKDYQIKHMGHRIELGEIESISNSLGFVEKSCCLYNDTKKRIVLFCELKDKERTVADIRMELRNKLSEYMMPRTIIIKDRLPINKNGKIDRQLLKEDI